MVSENVVVAVDLSNETIIVGEFIIVVWEIALGLYLAARLETSRSRF